MAKHDENKDVKLLSRIVKVNPITKTIKAPKGTLIGIRSWGRIDYLTHYREYVFIWDNTAKVGMSSNDSENSSSKRVNKKQKEYLTDKTRKTNKRKQNE